MIGLKLIAILFLGMAAFRLFNFNKEFYIFGFLLNNDKAKIARIISALVMLFLFCGFLFGYIWAFWLFLIDFLVGLVSHVMFLVKPNEKMFRSKKIGIVLNIIFIVFWVLVFFYVFGVYF